VLDKLLRLPGVYQVLAFDSASSGRAIAFRQFDVVADGEVVFSKQREGRFPEEDEILAALTA